MAQSERLCRTCRHFQPSPLLNRGWCRNPVLFGTRHQHLVDAHGRECQRAFGDFWQPCPGEEFEPPSPDIDPPCEPDNPLIELMPGLGRLRVRASRVVLTGLVGGLLLISAIRPASGISDQVAADIAPIATPSPSLSSSLAAVDPTATAVPFPPATEPTAIAPGQVATEPSLAPMPATATPEPVIIAAPASPTPEPTPRPAVAEASTPTATATPGRLATGAQAVVTTGTTGLRLRVRRAPGLDETIVGRISHGERLRILAGPRAVDGATWWQVEYAGISGWVAGDFLVLAPRA